MTHNHLVSTITEVKNLRSLLKKSKQTQIRSNIEKDYIRAVIVSWYQNHREALTGVISTDQLTEIDKIFSKISELAEKLPSRQKTDQLLKTLSTKLIKAQSQILVTPSKKSENIPNFSKLISDKKMQDILKNRWNEIEKCLSVGASLSAVVMMGGLLEGLLMTKAIAFSDKAKLFKCKSIPLVKKNSKKIPMPLNEWTLKVYIDVAHEMKWIGNATKDVGSILRDYRNYIHPQKEFTHRINVSLKDAQMFWTITATIINELL